MTIPENFPVPTDDISRHMECEYQIGRLRAEVERLNEYAASLGAEWSKKCREAERERDEALALLQGERAKQWDAAVEVMRQRDRLAAALREACHTFDVLAAAWHLSTAREAAQAARAALAEVER